MQKFKDIYGKMKPREKAFFYAAVGALIFMMTDLLVLNPILSEIKVLEAEITAKSQSIQRDMRIVSFKDSIVGEYRQYEQHLDSGEKTQEEIIAGLLKKLENVATENKIKITNVMPGELEDKPIYKIYKTTLEFEGTLKETLLFMNVLEESDNLFQITRYMIAPKNKSGESMKANMDVSRILITAEDITPFIDADTPSPVTEAPPETPAAEAAEKPEGEDMGVPEPI